MSRLRGGPDIVKPSFEIPDANHDEANHASNENMEVARIYAGIQTTAALLAELASSAAVPSSVQR